MKKVIITACALLILSIVLVSCTNNNIQSDKPSPNTGDCWTYHEYFSDFDSFEKYCKKPENQTEKSKIDPSALVNFDSIIPNSEIKSIYSYNNYYEIAYNTPTESFNWLQIRISYSEDSPDETNKKFEETAIENTDMSEEKMYYFDINGTCVAYKSVDGTIREIFFRLGTHAFRLDSFLSKNDNRTDAQKAFIEAFFTEEGTADMLERIKALLPQE